MSRLILAQVTSVTYGGSHFESFASDNSGGIPLPREVCEMSSSTGVMHDWFTVLGSQTCRPESQLYGDCTQVLLWPRTSVLELGPSDTAPASARRHVCSVLPEWGFGAELVDDVSLIGSELAANALRATLELTMPEPVGLRLLANSQRLVIEVWDCGPGMPVRQALPDFRAESGRGLCIVENLANRWGCRRASAHVKAVWAEMLLPRAQ